MSQKIKMSIFRPKESPKAIVEIVHGMAEHRKRYDNFASFLQKNGYFAVSFDLPGHGEYVSEDGLGYFGDDNGWLNLLESIGLVYEDVHKQYPDVPIFLFGHSMGSILARCYIQENDADFKGLILSGAPNYNAAAKIGILLGKRIRLSKGAKGRSRLMDALVTGNFNRAVKNPKTPIDWISYNEENIKQYLEDPYCGFGFTVQGYIDELTGVEQMHQVSLYRCNNKEMPILFVAGEDDPCTGGEKGLNDSMDTLKKAGYTNIRYVRYKNMRHEILNEVDHELVYNDILNWLNEMV